MKITVNITVDVDPQVWAEEYGIDTKDVREDVRAYVREAVWNMPVAPRDVKLRSQ